MNFLFLAAALLLDSAGKNFLFFLTTELKSHRFRSIFTLHRVAYASRPTCRANHEKKSEFARTDRFEIESFLQLKTTFLFYELPYYYIVVCVVGRFKANREQLIFDGCLG